MQQQHPLLPNLTAGLQFQDLVARGGVVSSSLLWKDLVIPRRSLSGVFEEAASSESTTTTLEELHVEVTYSIPHHRWFTDSSWGTLLAFGGVLHVSSPGPAQKRMALTYFIRLV